MSAFGMSLVMTTFSGRRVRKRGFDLVIFIALAVYSLRTQRVTALPARAFTRAKAVPQAPAPMTAMLFIHKSF
jgi:hypothetical protein